MIAAYNPIARARPTSTAYAAATAASRRPLDLAVGPSIIHSNFDFLRDESTTGTEQFDAISHLLIDGARRVSAQTLLAGLLSDVVSQSHRRGEFKQLVPHAETVDVSGTGHMIMRRRQRRLQLRRHRVPRPELPVGHNVIEHHRAASRKNWA